MTTRAKNLILLILAGMAIAMIGAITPKRSSYDQYVCTTCGLKRSEYKVRIGPIAYKHQISLEQTPISQALDIKPCSHAWLLYRFGHSSGFVLGGWRSHLDGGSRSYMLRALLADETFAKDLARMEHPSAVLKDLLVCLDDSQELDEPLGTWRQEPDRGSFSKWWETNQLLVHAVLNSTNR